ncbi:MAG: helix-turn-helix transcriptional regulator [Candidatus Competibacteraceae bacterium]|nr:helix-turn-helix transcriptional regulator [Candidatus Competibacteraceae bacterium]MCB1814698.1 helix-turn-helix transcriptional regulator [Candidatus Competibacteraceae bacterium]
MKKETAITALAALAQDTRLDIFRYLMEIGPEGAAAGKIAEHLEVPAATLSFHLKTLQHAGLILRRRQSQSLIYSANFEAMDGLLRYLTDNCCGGQPELCRPLPELQTKSGD